MPVHLVYLLEIGALVLQHFQVLCVHVPDLPPELGLFLLDQELKPPRNLLLWTCQVLHDVLKRQEHIEGDTLVHNFNLLTQNLRSVFHSAAWG